MNRKPLLERLGSEWLFFDGGSGTLLQAAGLKAGELPETWNLTHPEEIISLYSGYLNAGCDIFNSNTFGANALKFPDNLEEIVTRAVELAKEARIRCHREDACIALDMGPTGKLLEPMGDLSFEDAVSLYAQVVRAGTAAGADLVLIETMGDSYETKAAVLAAKENCSLPVFVTSTFDQTGKMLTGGTPESITALLEGLRVDALGVNCGMGPEQMLPIVERFLAASSLPVIVNPNAGLPRFQDGKTVYDIGPEEFAACMSRIADLGIHGAGGCCGTTPEHIRALIRAVKDKPFKPPVRKDLCVVSSFSKAVRIGERPILIGERINPTGKKKFKEALRSGDIDYILSEGLAQEDAGADILDVNVGLPEIDEPAMLCSVIRKLQGILALPLQIDTADTSAMERAMRIYNGKPMINSVNGKKETMDAVFPLAAKYGGVIVALLLDENGIPQTADGRLAIAGKIYAEAAAYGIDRKDIVLDALCLTISSDSRSALVTLEALQRIRDELHGYSILGVSNISFGLPRRELINSAFFTMALMNGLSSAIINPNNAAMMDAYRSYLALAALDPNCEGFIRQYAGTSAPTASGPAATAGGAAALAGEGEAMTLAHCIERGMEQKAALLARKALDEGSDALTLINEQLIPALDKVGKGFEAGTLFLPQLLTSAEAARAAFDVVREALKGAPRTAKGQVIVATVKGDIHDIGKNIVKVLLENYGFDVLDLGKDVPPEVIVRAAIDHDIRAVGLSALMTTTVVSMEETIRLLHEKKPDAKAIVGGAVMNEEYAAQIGADFYARDAMATVHLAEQINGS